MALSTERESVARTLFVAAAVALVCSVMVTAAVFYLRPIQAVYANVERNRAVIMAAGGTSILASDSEVVEAFFQLEASVFDLATGVALVSTNAHTYNYWQGLPDTEPAYLSVFLKIDKGKLSRVILPIHGKGMWSTIYGFLALQSDLNTIASLVIFKHGETPGIGDKILNPEWLSSWEGRQVADEDGVIRITVSKDSTPMLEQYQIDTITGATVTSEAIGRIVRRMLGPGAYTEIIGALHKDWSRYFEIDIKTG
ncbi:MAG: FMN-binding protein [Pseudomonadales bacterium]|nr:FMN-binding protein [Pseudomonadales bacterium]